MEDLAATKKTASAAAKAVKKAAEPTAKGLAREAAARVTDRVEAPAELFKHEAAERIEGLAEQVRSLGRQLDRPDEAHSVARRLERTADYLRFRPPREVADDAWQGLKRSRALIITGGLLGAWIAYRLVRSFDDHG